MAGVAAVLLLGMLFSGCSKPDTRPNILMVVLDTVRADYVGPDGAGWSRTPNLDALADSATVFDHAFSAAPWTVPSHASFFTGLLPEQHGCDSLHPMLDGQFHTLAGQLGSRGYRTAAFFSNPWLSDRATGLLRGFAHVSEARLEPRSFTQEGGADSWDQGGTTIVRRISTWLHDAPRDRPFFVFVNLFEAHLPYDPPPDYRARHLADLPPDDVVNMGWVHEFSAGLHPARFVDWDRVRRLYTGDVHTVDRMLGAILAALDREGLRDDTVIVVTADHGENLGEHDRVAHQYDIHETLLSVPLVVRAPGLLPPGRRSEPVELTDLYATLLAAAGADDALVPPTSRSLLSPPPPDAANRPLVAAYQGPPPALLRLLGTLNPDFDAASLGTAYRTVRVGDFRLTEGSDGSSFLNDLAHDPGQLKDVSAAYPERARELAALLRAMQRRRSPEGDVDIDAATRAQLRSLGY